jgi:undecaprenyl-diphosphatase
MIRLSVFSFWLLVAALALIVCAAFLLGGTDAPADRAILIAAQVDALVAPARIVTRFGDWWAVLLIGAVAAAWLMLRRRYRAALLLAALLVSERLVVAVLKLGFARDRPDPAGHLDAVHTMAFPSGHSANAITLGLGIALVFTAPGKARTAAVAAGLLFASLVGGSRMVLGVHWPSDVAGGWAFGALWTLLLLRLAAERGGANGIESPKQGETS